MKIKAKTVLAQSVLIENFYDSRPDNTDCQNLFDAPTNDTGPATGMFIDPDRHYFEPTRVTNAPLTVYPEPREDEESPVKLEVERSARIASFKRIKTGRGMRIRADISLFHPEQYIDGPGLSEGSNGPGDVFSFFPPVDVVHDEHGVPEGPLYNEDADVGQFPRGHGNECYPGLSGDPLEGDLGSGDHDHADTDGLNRATHEDGDDPAQLSVDADFGHSRHELVEPALQDNIMSDSPDSTGGLLEIDDINVIG
jgi:hypothetical protein